MTRSEPLKLIVLDRDGVINEDSDDYIKCVEEWVPIPGSMRAIGELTQAGYTIAVITNQSGVGRGYYTLATLNAMHEKMQALAVEHGGHIDRIEYCPHTPDDFCDCRKPKPGMFKALERHYHASMEGVLAVGDSLRDIEAARAVGAHPVLVRTGKGERSLAVAMAKGISLDGVPVYDSLADFVAHLLG